jgi:MFS family permease
LLLTVAVGGVIVTPLSGPVVTRIGPRRAVTATLLLVIAILMALSAAIAGATRRSPEQRPQTGSDTQAHTALM